MVHRAPRCRASTRLRISLLLLSISGSTALAPSPLPHSHTAAAAPRAAALRAVAEPTAPDGRLRLSSLGALGLFGFTAGPLVDAVHNQALLSYDFLPLALPIFDAKTSWVVPPLLAVAYALLGGVLPVAAERLIGSGQLRGVPLGRACTAPIDFLAPGQRAALAVASTVGIIKLSEGLVVAALPTAATLAVLSACCVLQWLVLDGAWASLALALLAGFGGPLCELPIMKLGAWHYIAPDYFPLRPILGDGSDAWAGLAGVTGPCYFAVTTDAIALGRWVGGGGRDSDPPR